MEEGNTDSEAQPAGVVGGREEAKRRSHLSVARYASLESVNEALNLRIALEWATCCDAMKGSRVLAERGRWRWS